MPPPPPSRPLRTVRPLAESMNPSLVPKLIGVALLAFVLLIISSATSYVIEPKR